MFLGRARLPPCRSTPETTWALAPEGNWFLLSSFIVSELPSPRFQNCELATENWDLSFNHFGHFEERAIGVGRVFERHVVRQRLTKPLMRVVTAGVGKPLAPLLGLV